MKRTITTVSYTHLDTVGGVREVKLFNILDKKHEEFVLNQNNIIEKQKPVSYTHLNESDETNIDQRKQYRYLYQRAMDSKDFDSFMKLAV